MRAFVKSEPYPRNRFNKFDCPEPGCDRTGKNGFDNPQGVGAHRRHAHGGAPNGNGGANGASQVGELIAAGASEDASPANVILNDDPSPAPSEINMRQTTFAAAAIRVAEDVRELSRDETSAVFGAIMSTK
jgi:hypothetical protein